ncbi:MAG: hypothetical protein IJ914_04565 [Prevotella sp.]|nr:hypothetical protein [Prevotella sp.]
MSFPDLITFLKACPIDSAAVITFLNANSIGSAAVITPENYLRYWL